MATLEFLGAAGTVTGSKYLLRACAKTFLIDAGLFQGAKPLRLLNWEPFPCDPAEIDFIAMTHAHIDHSGHLPILVRDGFKGHVLTTYATCDLLRLLLPDSGRLQEEEAATANKLGYSKHSPAKPLYTESDANRSLSRLRGIAYHQRIEPCPGVALTFRTAGHILGSASIEVEIDEPGRAKKRLLFSGDIGRQGAPILPDPEQLSSAPDLLLVECTYGDRRHPEGDPRQLLADAINEAHLSGGAIVIPSFAVGRAQDLLYHLRELENAGRIPVLDVFVDSPMAIDATPIYQHHAEDHDQRMRELLAKGVQPLRTRRLQFTKTVKESQRINDIRRCIIISASGMATGGRVLHHLKLRLPDPRNTVLIVGYQAEGTRGRLLQEGATTIKIHGEHVPVVARVKSIQGFSAHADWTEIDHWLGGFHTPPGHTLCVHGESDSLAATSRRLKDRGWKTSIPAYRDVIEL